jgi:hypothetical protein
MDVPPGTVKLTPLLATPPTVTTTLPVVAPAGTGTVMLVALQLVGVPAVPLNVTVLVPCVAPKFAPLIVTDVPTAPVLGFKLVMLGPGTVTVKLTPLLAAPPTVTTTLPVVAPAGTGATMLVALQLVGTAAMPLNVTVLVPCVAPKFAPLIVTEVPTNPDAGFRLAILAGEGFPPPPGLGIPVPLQPAVATANAKMSIRGADCFRVSLMEILFFTKDIISGLNILAPGIVQRKSKRREKSPKNLHVSESLDWKSARMLVQAQQLFVTISRFQAFQCFKCELQSDQSRPHVVLLGIL